MNVLSPNRREFSHELFLSSCKVGGGFHNYPNELIAPVMAVHVLDAPCLEPEYLTGLRTGRNFHHNLPL